MTSAFLRTVLVGVVLAAAGVETALPQAHEPAPVGAATVEPSDASAWDATWVGGWEGGEGTQVVIAGGQVIGFFWSGDYLSIEKSTNLADGYPIKFIWPGGEAIVQPGPHAELLLLIHEEGKPQTGFILTRQ